MSDIVTRARDYLAANAAESGADVLIADLADEIERLRRVGMRIAIVCDGKSWFVRRIATIEHNLDRDEMIYHCDMPLGGPFQSLDDAAQVVPFDVLNPIKG